MAAQELGFKSFVLFLLVLARVMGIFTQAPIFASHHIPRQGRVALSVICAMAIFSVVPFPKEFPLHLINLVLLILNQILVGLIIGYLSFIIMAGFQFAGELMDIQLGLSSAASFDPASGGTSNLLRRFQFYIAMLIYLIINGHHHLLRAIFKSFELVPVTGFTFTGNMIEHLIAISGDMFILAVQISAPVLASLFITQAALGLLARVAPQMNVFMMSFPLNMLVGMTLLAVSLPLINIAFRQYLEKYDIYLVDLIRAMGW